ncbi:unnamed protein product, partial [Prorocentrum cordatum]
VQVRDVVPAAESADPPPAAERPEPRPAHHRHGGELAPAWGRGSPGPRGGGGRPIPSTPQKEEEEEEAEEEEEEEEEEEVLPRVTLAQGCYEGRARARWDWHDTAISERSGSSGSCLGRRGRPGAPQKALTASWGALGRFVLLPARPKSGPHVSVEAWAASRAPSTPHAAKRALGGPSTAREARAPWARSTSGNTRLLGGGGRRGGPTSP